MVHRHLLEPRHLPAPTKSSRLHKPRPKTRQLHRPWLCAAPPVKNAQAAKLNSTASDCSSESVSAFALGNSRSTSVLSPPKQNCHCLSEAPRWRPPHPAIPALLPFSSRRRNSCSLPAIPERSQNGTITLIESQTRLVSGFCKRLWECMCLPI